MTKSSAQAFYMDLKNILNAQLCNICCKSCIINKLDAIYVSDKILNLAMPQCVGHIFALSVTSLFADLAGNTETDHIHHSSFCDLN